METLFTQPLNIWMLSERPNTSIFAKTLPIFFRVFRLSTCLSMKPGEVDHPEWMAHIAALAYVGLDPNLPGSQYLQGWAMEDRQTVREGPGVAYEFLWGNPYLPGVGYESLAPWTYDPERGLFARADWSTEACWIQISKRGIQERNCAPGWPQRATTFGHLTLMPLKQVCVEVPRRKLDEAEIISGLRPNEALSYLKDKTIESGAADAAGLWLVPANIAGNVCAAARHMSNP